ncbi:MULTISPECIES: FtsB family cell division protein [Bacillus]|uniref:Cell division protein DIVIC n=1 Tax=Bacillus toyonensis TaxID=155322 RepID=A0A1V6LEC7_9BACI|nr:MULTISPECIES: septum formation initiator family protein [Bacillus]EOP23367.1 cell division protein DIVIC [Bacillus cereus VD131]KNH40450.1 cell division protein DIVIC [Bacillus thuringiensis]KXY18977.1 cell division protein DIVIC [Bacillus cereus]MDH8705265.1 cell division protein DivIC [Stenotrophomonas sp. 1198]OTW75995.1 cell division protein DIVIC [Bacillus thuringiensis serovar cameroun]OTX00378.1 cell division protein DIVIC [Bacillus thuringiensis serovar seoulensis]PKR93058.1 hypot
MRKLKRVNVPNIPEQLSQPSDNRTINKKKLRRLILMVLFIAATTLYVQYILTKQQEIIMNKKDTITNQKKQLVTLKKDQSFLKTNIENLTDNEEEILKFARKEYQFSKSNETIFVLPK